jgi:hypothetical protein
VTSPALSLDAIDLAWDDEPSGVRARPRHAPPPLRDVLARELVAIEEQMRQLGARRALVRRHLGERMSPGERVEAAPGVWVEAVSARVNAAGEVVGSSGVRVRRKAAG